MPITILIGAQWGDEGKGRVVDWLAASADIVARFAGGDNAGHTVALEDKVYKLHLIPSGVLHSNVVSVMGNGMVINPVNLVREIDSLRQMGVEITPDRLVISSRAHIITPAHIALDKAKESALGDAQDHRHDPARYRSRLSRQDRAHRHSYRRHACLTSRSSPTDLSRLSNRPKPPCAIKTPTPSMPTTPYKAIWTPPLA